MTNVSKMLKTILSLLLVVLTIHSMTLYGAAKIKKKKNTKAKITSTKKVSKKKINKKTVAPVSTLSTVSPVESLEPVDSKITLHIRPVPKSELDTDLFIEFTVTNSRVHELPHNQYPRTCVLTLPILAQNPKYYLGKTSVFVQQTDLKEYGLSSSEQSVAIRLADNQDIKTVISLWDDQSQGISFSELDNQDMGKFIAELTEQLKSNCGQSSLVTIK